MTYNVFGGTLNFPQSIIGSYTHSTRLPVLRHLPWLPVWQRIEFKLAGSFGVWSAEWPVSTILGGWLPAYLCCWPTTTWIVQRCHVWGSKNSHKSGRSLIHCCSTTSVQQPASLSMWFWTYFPGPKFTDTVLRFILRCVIRSS